MLAKGKVSGEEMRQLAEAGIGAWDYLAKATGKSTAEVMKLSEKGLLPAKESIKVIVEGMQQDFGGMMEKQSKTFSGMMSTLKDGTNEAFGTVVKPLFNEFTNTILPVAIQKVEQFTEGFKKDGLKGGLTTILSPEDAKGVITVLDSITAMGTVAGNALSTVAGPATDITKAVLEWKPLIPTVLGLVTAMTAMNVAQTVTPAVLALKTAITTFYMEVATGSSVLTGFGNAMGTIMGPAGWITLGIGAVVGLTTAIIAYNAQQDEMTRKNISAANSAVEAQKKNQELIDKYIKLKSEAGESAQKTAELTSITQQLTNTIPGATAVINDQTLAIQNQKIALDHLNQAQRDSMEAGYLSASATIDKQKSQLKAAQEKEDFLRKLDSGKSWKEMGYKSYNDYEKDYDKNVGALEGLGSLFGSLGQKNPGDSYSKDLLSKSITERQKVEEQVNASQKIIDAWDKTKDDLLRTHDGDPYGYSKKTATAPPLLSSGSSGSGGGGAAGLIAAIGNGASKSKSELNEFTSALKQFFQQMNSMRDSIASFGSAFEKMTYEKFSPEKIKNRLNRTLKEIEKWRANLADLANRGVDEYTMNQLRSLGMSGAGIVAGMDKMSISDLKQSLNTMGLIRQGAGAEAYLGTKYKYEHEVSGKIDVYGIDSKGQLTAVTEIVKDELARDKNRYGFDPDTTRRLK
jgi:hypothetical protein